MQLHAAVNDAPTGAPLAAATVSSRVVPESCCFPSTPFVSFRGLHAPVSAGQSLAIVLNGTAQAQWVGAGFGGYPFGTMMDQFYEGPGGAASTPWQPITFLPGGFDGSFRALVERDVVPEPGTMMLFATGALVIARHGRWRRRRAEENGRWHV
jgi:hypothetical protein